MTEAEWLVCVDPVPMMKFLGKRMSDRNLRLLAVAIARLLANRLPEELRGAVEVGERLADGFASEEERLASVHKLHAVPLEHHRRTGENWFVVTSTEDIAASSAALKAVGRWHPGTDLTESIGWRLARLATADRQPPLIRDIFESPFRPVTFVPEWRTDAVVALACRMYDSHDFSTMPALADALQDAGCDSGDILTHCRDPQQVHVRGCWVVDLVLDKT